MYVQSNDLFYSPGEQGLGMVIDSGMMTGNVTKEITLYDAGTEVNEQPESGANQPPRQSGPDTGQDEMGAVVAISGGGHPAAPATDASGWGTGRPSYRGKQAVGLLWCACRYELCSAVRCERTPSAFSTILRIAESRMAETNRDITTGMVHDVPVDMQQALMSDPDALERWNVLTPLARNEWICWTISVKKPETRATHILRLCAELKHGKRRPCRWAGCPHR